MQEVVVKLTRLEYSFELVSGFMLGIEFVDMEDIYENEKGLIIVVDLGIFRVVIEKTTSIIN